MTVRELKDALDAYIKRDPPDIWQTNDVELDAKAYAERCAERAGRNVIILSGDTLFSAQGAFGAGCGGKDVFVIQSGLTI